MVPCTCGHQEFHHDPAGGTCRTCGCAAFVAEGSNCEPLTADELERGVPIAERGCRAGDSGP